MTRSVLETPVVFIVFNRPDLTERVLARIAEARPRTLYVIADGPRPGRPEDPERVARTRAVLERVDWDCDLIEDFSEHNLGCGRRIASGLDRVFSRFEEAIILEDDCLPDPSFFGFCRELLERYRDDPRVMNVTGEQASRIRPPRGESYFFTSLPRIWGWATWARAWKGYDFELRDWADDRPEFLRRLADYYKGGRPLCRRMDKVVENRIDTWDYQWFHHVFKHEGLCINPAVNLVSNLGFDERATHSWSEEGRDRCLPTRSIPMPLVHPPRAELDRRVDRRFFFERFGRPLPARIRSRARQLLGLSS
ncbi:MAG: glycosyltransferase family 2 protein [bacterium]